MTVGLRVLHVIGSLSPKHGGTTSSVLHLVEALKTAGVISEILTTDDNGPGERLLPDAPERAIPGRHYVEKRRDFYCFGPGMGPKLKDLLPRFDLVHIHGLFTHASAVAAKVCRASGVPYVVTPHGMVNRYGMAHKSLQKKVSMVLVERQLLKRASAVHLTSQSEAENFQLLGLDRETALVPLPVDPLPLGDRQAFLDKWPDLQGKRPVLFMGRLNPVKNIPSLIAAMPQVLQSAPDAVLVLAGEGDATQTDALRSQAKDLDVPMVMTGFISGTDRDNALAAAEVFVLPSHSESFGLAALEALSVGCPLALSDGVAVAKDLATKGLAHIGAPTPKGLAQAITSAIAARTDWDPFAARNHVALAFSPAKVASDLVAVYQRSEQVQKRPADAN